jgi:hypothetical protein
MSIATEITALQTNLTAAKNAVTSKGGTVGNTGLAGLATEIASIPSGGSLSSYGTLTYLDGSTTKTLDLISEDYYLELTLSTVSANFHFKFGDLDIPSGAIQAITIADGVQYIPNYFMYYCSNLTTVNLPNSIHYIGDMVFSRCNVTSTINLSNVAYIGSNFLSFNSNFNQPLNLPKVEEIGDYFLRTDTAFNSTVTLPDHMYKIGSSFLQGCSAFAQTLTLPLLQTIPNTANPGPSFMYGCNEFTGPLVCNTPNGTNDANTLAMTQTTVPAYTTGITLTGTYANAWKTAFPDRTTSPYRKLIVGS